jgi:hypothetical protein
MTGETPVLLSGEVPKGWFQLGSIPCVRVVLTCAHGQNMSKRNKSQSTPGRGVAQENTSAPATPKVASTVAVANGAQAHPSRRPVAPQVPDGTRAAEANVREAALRSLNDDLMALSSGSDGSPAAGRASIAQNDPGTGTGGELEARAAGTVPDQVSSLVDPSSAGPADGAPAEDAQESEGGDEDSQSQIADSQTDDPHPDPLPSDGRGSDPADGNLEGEDLDALTELDEDQLNAHAKAQRWPDSYLKRIKKFTRQQKATLGHVAQLIEERQQMEAELAAARDPASAPAGAGTPPAGSGSAASLREQRLLSDISQREAALDTIEAHLASPEGQAGEPLVRGDKQYPVAMLRATKRQYEREANVAAQHLDELRRANEANRRQFDAQAAQAHPWLKDRSHESTMAIEQALREYPVLSQIPRIRLILADHVAWQGQAAKSRPLTQPSPVGRGTGDAANGNGNGNAQPARAPAARVPARPAAAPLPPSRAENDGRAAVSQALKTGKFEDGARAVLSLIEK